MIEERELYIEHELTLRLDVHKMTANVQHHDKKTHEFVETINSLKHKLEHTQNGYEKEHEKYKCIKHEFHDYKDRTTKEICELKTCLHDVQQKCDKFHHELTHYK